MKANIKKILSAVLFALLVLFAVPLIGHTDSELNLNWLDFSTNSSAESYGSLLYTVSDGKVTIEDCDDTVSGEFVIPSMIEGYCVTNIDDYAFYGCEDLTGITVPDGVTRIGVSAFAKCVNLEKITIPGSVKNVGALWVDCTDSNLMIDFKGSLDDFYSFNIFGGLTENDCIRDVYDNVYNLYCNGEKCLFDLHLYKDNLGIYFHGDTSLTSVTIPSKIGKFEVEYLDIHYCSPEIEKITISEGIKYLDGGIYPNTGLKEITIPNSIERISRYFLGDGYDYSVEKINYCGTLDEFYSLTIASCWDGEETEEDLEYFYGIENMIINDTQQH